jgi:ABC-type antimicrobial peptide transport system permease subunit
MAMRSFSRHRGRTATTVAVIVVGIFSVSFVVILAEGIKDTFKEVFAVNLGYNVVAADFIPVDRTKLQSSLAQLPGYENGFIGNRQAVTIEQVNGQDWNTYVTSIPATPIETQNQAQPTASDSIQLSGRDFIDNKSGGTQKILSGRALRPDDAAKQVMVLNQHEATIYNLKVGDTLTVTANNFRRGGQGSNTNTKTTTFEIIGIQDNSNQTINIETPWIVPYQATTALGSQQTLIYLLIDRAQLDTALNKLQTTQPSLFIINISDFIDEFSHILDQFLAFPTMLSFLSLLSGAILIANNVALAMLERRTEIGILKAIGAKQQRIMNMILWESSLTGFLGGALGVGMALLLLILSGSFGGGSGSRASNITINWSPLVAVSLVLMSIGLAVFATIASAWSAVREKPLVVLRYE